MKFTINGVPSECIISFGLDPCDGIRFSGKLKVFRKPINRVDDSVWDIGSDEMISQTFYIKENSFHLFNENENENVVGSIAFI